MSELETDILDRGGRLRRIAVATLIGGTATFFVLRAMIHAGRGPQQDPIGQASVVLMGVFMFALSSVTVLKLITRLGARRRRPSDGSDA